VAGSPGKSWNYTVSRALPLGWTNREFLMTRKEIILTDEFMRAIHLGAAETVTSGGLNASPPSPDPRLPDSPRRPEEQPPIEEPAEIPPEVPNPIGDKPIHQPEPIGQDQGDPQIGAVLRCWILSGA